jgi:hypothetical protein
MCKCGSREKRGQVGETGIEPETTIQTRDRSAPTPRKSHDGNFINCKSLEKILKSTFSIHLLRLPGTQSNSLALKILVPRLSYFAAAFALYICFQILTFLLLLLPLPLLLPLLLLLLLSLMLLLFITLTRLYIINARPSANPYTHNCPQRSRPNMRHGISERVSKLRPCCSCW